MSAAPEPRTHYQASFTGKQALGLFVGLLLALAVAYFLGVMTGLAGRDGEPPPEAVAAAETATGESPSEVFPTPVLGVQPKAPGPGRILVPPEGGAAAGVLEPTRPDKIQLFEDRAEGERPESLAPPPAGPPASGFWVQVVSLSSPREAQTRSARLTSRGYKASVSPASGPRGTVYRVRVGPFERREEAANTAQRLSVEEKAETWIVPARPE